MSKTQTTILEQATLIRNAYRTKELEMVLFPQYYNPIMRVALHVLNDYAMRLQGKIAWEKIAQTASKMQRIAPQTLSYAAAWPLFDFLHQKGDRDIVRQLIKDTIKSVLFQSILKIRIKQKAKGKILSNIFTW